MCFFCWNCCCGRKCLVRASTEIVYASCIHKCVQFHSIKRSLCRHFTGKHSTGWKRKKNWVDTWFVYWFISFIAIRWKCRSQRLLLGGVKVFWSIFFFFFVAFYHFFSNFCMLMHFFLFAFSSFFLFFFTFCNRIPKLSY